MQHVRVGRGGPDPADLEARPGGVVEVAVGGDNRPQELGGTLGSGRLRQDRRDLKLGVEGDAGDFLLYQDGVLDALAGLLPPPPRPAACEQPQGRARSQERRLPYLPVLHPQVALEGGERADAEDGHRHAVHLQRLGLVGVGGLSRLHAGTLVGLFEMGLGPVGAQGAQKQPRHHALVVLQGRERAHQGDEGVGAGVEQVVVPECSQRDVLGTVRPQAVHPAPAGEARTSEGSRRAGQGRTRVLAVDDDPQTLRLVRDALSNAGYTVTGDPEQVGRLVEEERPHLVLLDLMLPGMDGIELMESVPELADLPVIFLSAYGRDQVIARALGAGAEDYVVKPFSPTELVARVQTVLRRRAASELFGSWRVDWTDWWTKQGLADPALSPI